MSQRGKTYDLFGVEVTADELARIFDVTHAWKIAKQLGLTQVKRALVEARRVYSRADFKAALAMRNSRCRLCWRRLTNLSECQFCTGNTEGVL